MILFYVGPSYGVYFLSYKYFKSVLSSKNTNEVEEEKEDIVPTLISGAIAGCMSWASVYPLDVVKSNIQVMCNLYNYIHTVYDMIQGGGGG